MSQTKLPKPTPVGGEMIPPRPRINSLQALMRLKPLRGSEWNVIAFILNRDMIQPDGTLDDLHAVVFCLGSFSSQGKAEAHAKKIIEITGHNFIVTVQYGLPLRLATKFDPASVVEVPVDLRGRLIQMDNKKEQEERAEFERRLKIEREIVQEAEAEVDLDHIEHFKRQAFLAVKNRAAYHTLQKQADTAWNNYKKREAAVRDHFERHPEHEAEFLPYLKTKLEERGEMMLYAAIETGYQDLRAELLGLEPTPAPPIPVFEAPAEEPEMISEAEMDAGVTPTQIEAAALSNESPVTPIEIETAVLSNEPTVTPTEIETAVLPDGSGVMFLLPEIKSPEPGLSDPDLMIDPFEVPSIGVSPEEEVESCEDGVCRVSSDLESDPGFITETLSDSETAEPSEIQSAVPAPSARPAQSAPPAPISLELPEMGNIGLISSSVTKRGRRGRR